MWRATTRLLTPRTRASITLLPSSTSTGCSGHRRQHAQCGIHGDRNRPGVLLWPLLAEARAVMRLRGAVLVEGLFVIGRNGSADRPSRWKGKRPAPPALVKVPLFLTRQVRQGLCAAWAIHLEAIANHGKSVSGWRARSHPANPRFIREVHLSPYRRHWTDRRQDVRRRPAAKRRMAERWVVGLEECYFWAFAAWLAAVWLRGRRLTVRR